MPEELQELSFSQLYEKLLIEDDIILDQLPADQLKILRKGLSSYKTKNNNKLKRADLPTEDRRIEFETLKIYENEGTLKIRVYFLGIKKLTAKVVQPDKELK